MPRHTSAKEPARLGVLEVPRWRSRPAAATGTSSSLLGGVWYLVNVGGSEIEGELLGYASEWRKATLARLRSRVTQSRSQGQALEGCCVFGRQLRFGSAADAGQAGFESGQPFHKTDFE